MSTQTEADIREEAKAALGAAWKVLKPFVEKMDGGGKILFLRIGHVHKNIGVTPLKTVNELLALVREKLGSYGRQVIAGEVFDQVDRAIETTGAATFFEGISEKAGTP